MDQCNGGGSGRRPIIRQRNYDWSGATKTPRECKSQSLTVGRRIARRALETPRPVPRDYAKTDERRSHRKLLILWLGREDSNLRMAESKSAALPLGDAPSWPADRRARTIERRHWRRKPVSGAGMPRFHLHGAAERLRTVPPLARPCAPGRLYWRSAIRGAPERQSIGAGAKVGTRRRARLRNTSAAVLPPAVALTIRARFAPRGGRTSECSAVW